ncbi:putative membrane protein [Candidatus Phytoplasma solani]|uniref:YitT family protein n=1 Tax=Candidatus Phytoplasma solani TaxID=69896 RepID=UPI0032DB0F48
MNKDKQTKFNYWKELKKLLIVFACLIGYDLVSIWALNCTGGPSGKNIYQTDLYPGGIHGLGDCIGKILKKANVLQESNQITTFAMIFYLIVNVFLLLFISYCYLDKYFTITTAVAALFLSLMGLFLNWAIKHSFLKESERFFGFFPFENNFPMDVLRSTFAGLLIGFFNGIIIKLGSSTGGIDVIGKYLVIYKQKNISLIIEIFGYSLIFVGVCASLILNKENFFKFETIQGIFCALLRIKLTAFVIDLINYSKPKLKQVAPN